MLLSVISVLNDNLAYQLKDIYNYWFNQFDFPHNDKHQYKADEGLMIWNDKIKDSSWLGDKIIWRVMFSSQRYQLR